MKKVNINNYEAYLVDYFEDNLSLEDRNQVDLFLKSHPEIFQEVSDWVDNPSSFSNYGYNYSPDFESKNFRDDYQKLNFIKYKHRHNNNWKKFSYAAAACVSLLLIGGGLMYFINSNTTSTPSPTTSYNNVAEIVDSIVFESNNRDLHAHLGDDLGDNLGQAQTEQNSDLGLAQMGRVKVAKSGEEMDEQMLAQANNSEKKDKEIYQEAGSTIKSENSKSELSHYNMHLSKNDTINYEYYEPNFEALKSLFDWTSSQQLAEVAETEDNNNNSSSKVLAYFRKNTKNIIKKVNKNYQKKKAKVENSIYKIDRLLANSSQK